MIEIVKYPEHKYQKLRMKCNSCDCVFDATFGEIKDIRYENIPWETKQYEINCPMCGRHISTYPNETELWNVYTKKGSGVYEAYRVSPKLFNV